MGARESFYAGQEAFAAGDFALAIQEFQFALQQDDMPVDGTDEIWFNIAHAYLKLGQVDQADIAAENAGEHRAEYDRLREEHERAQAEASGPGREAFYAAQDAYQREEWALAIELFEQALFAEEIRPSTRDEMYFNLAISYLRLGEWGRAEECAAAAGDQHRADYDQAKEAVLRDQGVTLSSDGSTVDDAFVQARRLFDQGDYTTALALIEEIDVSETSGGFSEEVAVYRALCLLRLDRLDEADAAGRALTGAWRTLYDDHRAASVPAPAATETDTNPEVAPEAAPDSADATTEAPS